MPADGLDDAVQLVAGWGVVAPQGEHQVDGIEETGQRLGQIGRLVGLERVFQSLLWAGSNTQIYTYIQTYMCVCVCHPRIYYTDTFVYRYRYRYVCVHICTKTHTDIHISTYICTYIDIHVDGCTLPVKVETPLHSISWFFLHFYVNLCCRCKTTDRRW